jgi:hypothetical protein
MTSLKSIRTLLGAVILAGCAYNPPPIPVIAPETQNLMSLEGDWMGDFEALSNERAGTIAFKLGAGTDTAFGEVVMIPRNYAAQRAASDPPGAYRSGAMAAVPVGLAVSFVRLSGGYVAGELDPYVDPDIGCIVLTTFTGSFRDAATLAGEYVTKDEDGYVMRRGRWLVKRIVK